VRAASTKRHWVRRILLIASFSCAVVAAAAAVTYAIGLWGTPVPGDVQAQVKRAIVGYELAMASERPSGLVGKTLSNNDKAALQARFLRRLDRYATGPARAWGDTWDYAAALREDEWDTRELVGVTGRIVYWQGPRREADGEVHVKAGVATRYKVIAWDAAAGRAIPKQDWVTGVVVKDYILRQADGAWKVADSATWRYYDPANGQLGTGP